MCMHTAEIAMLAHSQSNSCQWLVGVVCAAACCGVMWWYVVVCCVVSHTPAQEVACKHGTNVRKGTKIKIDQNRAIH